MECYNVGSSDSGPPPIADVHFLISDVLPEDVLKLNPPTVGVLPEDVQMLNLPTLGVLMLTPPTVGFPPADYPPYFPLYIRLEMRTRLPTLK